MIWTCRWHRWNQLHSWSVCNMWHHTDNIQCARTLLRQSLILPCHPLLWPVQRNNNREGMTLHWTNGLITISEFAHKDYHNYKSYYGSGVCRGVSRNPPLENSRFWFCLLHLIQYRWDCHRFCQMMGAHAVASWQPTDVLSKVELLQHKDINH